MGGGTASEPKVMDASAVIVLPLDRAGFATVCKGFNLGTVRPPLGNPGDASSD